jgi:glutathione synthase/RimK-type ligase-like ATP-grasp enzyme
MILIIAPGNDLHALSVAKAIYDHTESPCQPVAIFDATQLPLRSQITLRPTGWQLKDSEGRVFSSREVTTIWWRRAGAHVLSASLIDPAARRFAGGETDAAFNSILRWPDCRIINPVEKEVTADKKPVQLATAARIGLKVPQTLITNDPEQVERFWESSRTGKLIFKVLTPPLSSLAETRRFKPEHRPKLRSLVHAPAIFQEELEKAYDLRVTVVGTEIFSAWIEVQNLAGKAFPDWRLDAMATCHAYELPTEVEHLIRVFMDELGLYYGAIDLILTTRGEYFFLEVNPTGQFLFVEIDTGHQISAAFARLLLNTQGPPYQQPAKL